MHTSISEQDSYLSVRHLGASIGRLQVLVDVSFNLGRGGALGIVGETGSGKSLTCRAVVGLLEQLGAQNVTGEATFDGHDLLQGGPDTWHALRGRRIAFIPQSTASALD